MGKKARASKKISFRLTDEQDEAVERIMLSQGFKNRSQVLRHSLEHYIEDSQESYNSEKMTIDFSKVHLEELDKLLDFIGASSRKEAIRMALRQFLHNENEFLLKRTLEYEELRAKNRRTAYNRPGEVTP